MNRRKAEYNALYGDQAAFGGGSANNEVEHANGVEHASGGGTVSSRESGADSHAISGTDTGETGTETGSSGGDSRSGGGGDEVIALQVCTFASLCLQSCLFAFGITCDTNQHSVTYILGTT